MGFLDQEAELLKRQELERQAELQRPKIESGAELASQKTLEEDRLHAALEDNKIVIALLDNLPEMNLGEYVKIVARHTGYHPSFALYSTLGYYSNEEGKLEKDSGLNDKLQLKGIRFRSRVHPKEIFFGNDVHPRVTGFRFLLPYEKPLSEPQEPGIGISFTKYLETRYVRSENGHGSYEQHNMNMVYVRLLAPRTAVITGNGSRLSVTSLEVFDNALMEGFRNPHLLRRHFFREWEWKG